ncbi:exodeoxyribonuclease X [Escherichia coli]|nr:exodeoxyribonuclease X [Escherichia coli]
MLRIIDTETCGLQGGIVEIASVDVIDGKIVNPMSHLVRPDRPISPQAMAIHRITEAMVADKPWIEDVIPHYYGSEWYVAHNASFDHRALYDCYITAALLIDIMNTSGWTAEQMADITGRPSLMTTFTFGKYRGKAVSDVAERDPGYLRWLFNNLDSMSPELRLTLKHYLENT